MPLFPGMVIHLPVEEDAKLELIQQLTKPYSEQTPEEEFYAVPLTLGHLVEFADHMLDEKVVIGVLQEENPEQFPTKYQIDEYKEELENLPLRDFILRYIPPSIGNEVIWKEDSLHYMTNYNRKARFNALKLGFDDIPVIRKREVEYEETNPETGEKEIHQGFENYQAMEESLYKMRYPLLTYDVGHILSDPNDFQLPEYDPKLLAENPNDPGAAVAAFSFPSQLLDHNGNWHGRVYINAMGTPGPQLQSALDWNEFVLDTLKNAGIGYQVTFVQFRI